MEESGLVPISSRWAKRLLLGGKVPSRWDKGLKALLGAGKVRYVLWRV